MLFSMFYASFSPVYFTRPVIIMAEKRYSSINTHHYKCLFIEITHYCSNCLHLHCIVQSIVYFIFGIYHQINILFQYIVSGFLLYI